jgi:two-component system sensor histidine kinase RegB
LGGIASEEMSQNNLETDPFPLGQANNPIRLRTLVRLRWLAVIGQTAAVLMVSLVFGYSLPFSACLGVIALSAWLNIFISFRWRSSQILSTRAAGLLLAYDVVQLAALLFLTGGLENPFSFLFLVPVTVSATSLTVRWTLALGGMAIAFASLLAIYHFPLPWKEGETITLPATYVAGLWVAVLSGTAFSAIYARRLAEEARQMSVALNATEMVLAREQRLSALDGLAAAAAHELGTPLGTITVVAKELKREAVLKGHHADDLDLLISQAARCREILSRLSDREQVADVIFGQVKLSALLEDQVAPLRGSDVSVIISCNAEKNEAEPVFRRNPAISYALSNILENAIDFAKSSVVVEARWNASQLSIIISDDGPGFDQLIFDRLGDPFVTTRPGYDDAVAETSGGRGHEGMGLGLFIAKTLLERSGAQVGLSNLTAPAQGAVVAIRWPRAAVDVGLANNKALDPQPATLH